MEINRKHKYGTKLKNNYFVGYMNKLFNYYVVTNSKIRDTATARDVVL